jgi:DNA-binding transcriptional LysR family regulator
MRGFASVPLPLGEAGERWGELPMYMAWHQRHHQDAAHQWLRGILAEVAAEISAHAK